MLHACNKFGGRVYCSHQLRAERHEVRIVPGNNKKLKTQRQPPPSIEPGSRKPSHGASQYGLRGRRADAIRAARPLGNYCGVVAVVLSPLPAGAAMMSLVAVPLSTTLVLGEPAPE